MSHQSVLLNESIEGLNIRPDGLYVDGTFGRGGHSRAILEQLSEQGRLIAIDKDPAAVAFAQEQFAADKRFQIFQGSFTRLAEFTDGQPVDGILLDLGVSSPQLDEAARGFSFMQAGPLDMRMDLTQALDAATWVNQASLEEMIQVFREYGEERFARRIAQAIINARAITPLSDTRELAEIIKEANPKWEKHKHPATRVFQAIRIHINDELSDLKEVLKTAVATLARGGRLSVISFHSLEDRIVKQFMRDEEKGVQPPIGLPIRHFEIQTGFKRIGKAIKPSEAEVKNNVRARSAVLRIGEKTI